MARRVTTLSLADSDRLLEPLRCAKRLGLAVSGGPDSMALMHLVAAWLARRTSHAQFAQVVTVDHGLREGSAAEVKFVCDAAQSLGLEPHVVRWRGLKPATGVQARARSARYRLLLAHAIEHRLDAIVTAHNADDQAETLLMRLMRGSGIDGLAAMQASVGLGGGVMLLRPLLAVSKERLRATLLAFGGGSIDDPSNEDDRFERVRLRRSRAALSQAGIEWAALSATAQRLQRARKALETISWEAFQARVRCDRAAGWASIACRDLAELPDEVGLRVLGRAIAVVGGRAERVRLSRLERLLEVVSMGHCRGRTLGGCRISTVGSCLHIIRETGRRGLELVGLTPGRTAVWDRRFDVSLDSSAAAPATVRSLAGDEARRLRAEHNPLGKVPFEALLAIPSFWSGPELLALPALGKHCSPAGLSCASTFRWDASDHLLGFGTAM